MRASDVPETSNRLETGDMVRISEKHFHDTYNQAFRLWLSLHASAMKDTRPPFVSLGELFLAQPSLPRNLGLKRKEIGGENRVYAHGRSVWGASASPCESPLSSFQLPVQVEVAVTNTITLVTEVPTGDFYRNWFHGSRVYIAVLALAWSYILSARWAEVMPGSRMLILSEEPSVESSVETDSMGNDAFTVDIGDADSDEARWWSAILKQGAGWCATMSLNGETFVAPWSVQREANHRLVLAANIISPPSHPLTAPSYVDAIRFLQRFCDRHGVAAQSQAALAAVLLVPSLIRGQTLRLPISGTEDTDAPQQTTEHCHWNMQGHDLDRLIMLSCYTGGLQPMLLSIFYEPSIDCNAASAWLQGGFSAIDRLSRHGPLVMGRMLMARSPKVSLLWLGATTLGLQESLFRGARHGFIPINLSSAAWSGTIQTFLQLPPSSSVSTYISRADECRFLFLCQAEGHRRLPVVQWKPFGVTQLDDADIEVRTHATCMHHSLHYEGFDWVVQDDDVVQLRPKWPSEPWYDVSLPNSSRCVSHESDQGDDLSDEHISHEELDQAKANESISENATRSIFNWLRFNGWSRNEKSIWGHEWFEDWDSEEEEEEEVDESSPVAADKFSITALWITQLPDA